jgi:hypothetical protein
MRDLAGNDTVKAALLFAVGVVAIVVAVAEDWLSGDELSFVVLAALSGGVFVVHTASRPADRGRDEGGAAEGA